MGLRFFETIPLKTCSVAFDWDPSFSRHPYQMVIGWLLPFVLKSSSFL